MDKFNEIAKQCNKERLNEERKKRYDVEHLADIEFAHYSIWCRTKEVECNDLNYRLFKQEESRNKSFWVLKKLFEKYFGYKFEYDYDKRKWKSFKNDLN